MKIEINNRSIEVADGCKSLQQLLDSQSLSGPGLAVAVGNRVIPRQQWEATELSEGMKIVVIHAVCGG